MASHYQVIKEIGKRTGIKLKDIGIWTGLFVGRCYAGPLLYSYEKKHIERKKQESLNDLNNISESQVCIASLAMGSLINLLVGLVATVMFDAPEKYLAFAIPLATNTLSAAGILGARGVKKRAKLFTKYYNNIAYDPENKVETSETENSEVKLQTKFTNPFEEKQNE